MSITRCVPPPTTQDMGARLRGASSDTHTQGSKQWRAVGKKNISNTLLTQKTAKSDRFC